MILFLVGGSAAIAADYEVSPGDDIQAAINQLQAGDTLWFTDGIYYLDELRIENKSSSNNNRIYLAAVNPGMASLRCAWKKAADGTLGWTHVGGGVYKANETWHYNVFLGSYMDKPLHRINTVAELQALSITIPKTGGYNLEPTQISIPGYAYAVQNGYIHVRLPGDVNPNGKSILLGAQKGQWKITGQGIMTPGMIYVVNSPGVTFDGFHLFPGRKGIDFDDASTHGIVRNCLFESTGIGVDAADYTLVEWCEFYQPGLLEYIEEHYAVNGEALNNAYWGMVKGYGGAQGSPRTQALIASYRNPDDQSIKYCESRYNYMYNVWEGDKIGQMEYSSAHHNVYENMVDNASELETVNSSNAYGRELRFHHNLILGRQKGALAFEDQNSRAAMTGPMYIYNNVFDVFITPYVGENKFTFNTFLKCQSPSVTAYIYHNLFRERTERGSLRNFKDHEFIDFKNNIICIDQGQTQTNGDPYYWPSQNHNLFAKGKTPSLNSNDIHVSTEAAVKFVNLSANDYGLAADSPARNAGQILNVPGLQQNVTDGNPDIGPFEFGETMGSDWPRPRTRVFVDASPALVPSAHWTMDSADINGSILLDKSGNALNGIIQGATSTESGRINGALVFNGSSNYVYSPHSALLEPSHFTVATWFNADTLPTSGDTRKWLVCKNANEATDGNYSLIVRGGTHNHVNARMRIGTTTYQVSSPLNSVQLGTWNHTAMTYDGADFRLYLNGNLVATTAVNTARTFGSGILTIGRRGDNGYFFHGKIDDVRIYNTALAVEEVSQLYSESLPNLVAHWTMDASDVSGTSLLDKSNNGLHGIIYGATTTNLGRINGALDFNGSNAYIDRAHSPLLEPSNFTVATWFNADTLPTSGDTRKWLVCKNANEATDGNYSLIVRGGTHNHVNARMKIGAATYQVSSALNSVQLGVWNHAAMTFDGGSFKLYLNGTLVATTAVNAARTFGVGNLTIGRRADSGFHFDGRIDDVRIYSDAMSGADVLDLYSLAP
jgi:hypothetical protein